jgi:hypothetical protein
LQTRFSQHYIGADLDKCIVDRWHFHRGMCWRGREATWRRLESRLAAKNGRPTSAEAVSCSFRGVDEQAVRLMTDLS